jgi:hypothetical protein
MALPTPTLAGVPSSMASDRGHLGEFQIFSRSKAVRQRPARNTIARESPSDRQERAFLLPFQLTPALFVMQHLIFEANAEQEHPPD